MRIECYLVNLTMMLMQSGQLYSRAIQIVQEDLPAGGCRGNVGTVLAMRPLNIVYLQSLPLPGGSPRSRWNVGSIADNGSAEVDLLGAFGTGDSDRFENLAACKYGVGPLMVDVESSNLQACLVACILRGERIYPGGQGAISNCSGINLKQ